MIWFYSAVIARQRDSRLIRWPYQLSPTLSFWAVSKFCISYPPDLFSIFQPCSFPMLIECFFSFYCHKRKLSHNFLTALFKGHPPPPFLWLFLFHAPFPPLPLGRPLVQHTQCYIPQAVGAVSTLRKPHKPPISSAFSEAVKQRLQLPPGLSIRHGPCQGELWLRLRYGCNRVHMMTRKKQLWLSRCTVISVQHIELRLR